MKNNFLKKVAPLFSGFFLFLGSEVFASNGPVNPQPGDVDRELLFNQFKRIKGVSVRMGIDPDNLTNEELKAMLEGSAVEAEVKEVPGQGQDLQPEG